MNKRKNFRVAVGTKVQRCHCCNRNLKKEPFIRMDDVASGAWGRSISINICFKCMDEQHTMLNESLNDDKIQNEMLMHKLDTL